MLKTICPSCDSEISDRAKFCGKCGKPVRCPNLACGALISNGTDFCEECGYPISKATEQSPLNTFSYDVSRQGKNYEQHTQIAMTNDAVRDLAPFIVDRVFPEQTLHSTTPIRRGSSTPIREQNTLVGSLFPEEHAVIDVPNDEPESQAQNQSEIGAARFFERSGDYLVPRTKDFKGKNWADQSRHYLVLYIAADNSLFGKPVPDKNHFQSAADKAKIYDPGNFGKYVNQQISAFTMQINGGYKLNDDGEREVARIITLMDKQGSEAGYEYWKRESGSVIERHRLNNEDKKRLDKWAEEFVELGLLDIRDLKMALHYALVAFWILTHKLNKTDTVHRHDAYYYFWKKYTIISVSSQAFSRSVVDDEKEQYFRKSGEAHFLSSEALELVNGWIEGKPVEVPKYDKKEQKQ